MEWNKYIRYKFISIILFTFSCVLLVLFMGSSKLSNAKNKNNGLYVNQVLPVKYGKNGDLVIYFVDKKGLEKILKDKNKKQEAEQIKYEEFKASKGQLINLGILGGKKIILIGVDKDLEQEKKEIVKSDEKENIALDFEKIGAKIVGLLPHGKTIDIVLSNEYCIDKKFCDDKLLVYAYFGFNQRNYKFDKYLTDKDVEKKKTKIKNVLLDIKETAEIKKMVNEKQIKLDAIFFTRDISNEPANVIYPESFANIVKDKFKGIKNVKVKIIEQKELEKLGMNLLLGVAKGSSNSPKVVVVEYKGNSSSKKTDIALIGKGVCFDSGGMSLKPSQYMEGMKQDMQGAITQIASLYAIAKNGLKVNAIAVGGMVENMINGQAQKVGDIVKSMSGKTVEIIDTDAEGRLVLADILYYAQTTYKPEYLIDMATLTGAIMYALGTEKSGIFTNNKELGKKLYESGEKTGDNNWVMPLTAEYFDAIKSQIADLRNLGKKGSYAGSATAASLLANFIDDNKKWAHIDIAGVDTATGNNSFCKEGLASGYGVKLITDFIENNCL